MNFLEAVSMQQACHFIYMGSLRRLQGADLEAPGSQLSADKGMLTTRQVTRTVKALRCFLLAREHMAGRGFTDVAKDTRLLGQRQGVVYSSPPCRKQRVCTRAGCLSARSLGLTQRGPGGACTCVRWAAAVLQAGSPRLRKPQVFVTGTICPGFQRETFVLLFRTVNKPAHLSPPRPFAMQNA